MLNEQDATPKAVARRSSLQPQRAIGAVPQQHVAVRRAGAAAPAPAKEPKRAQPLSQFEAEMLTAWSTW
jgi:hypothetical protein